MKIEEAIRRAVKEYHKGKKYDNMESWKGRKYVKKYFDEIRSEMKLKKEESDGK